MRDPNPYADWIAAAQKAQAEAERLRRVMCEAADLADHWSISKGLSSRPDVADVLRQAASDEARD